MNKWVNGWITKERMNKWIKYGNFKKWVSEWVNERRMNESSDWKNEWVEWVSEWVSETQDEWVWVEWVKDKEWINERVND